MWSAVESASTRRARQNALTSPYDCADASLRRSEPSGTAYAAFDSGFAASSPCLASFGSTSLRPRSWSLTLVTPPNRSLPPTSATLSVNEHTQPRLDLPASSCPAARNKRSDRLEKGVSQVMSTATPAAPNGFATGSPQVQNQALASQYPGQPDAGPNRRSSISAYGVVAAPNVLPMATIPSAVQGMQLSQMQQQALLQRSQHALRPFSAAAPPSAVPPPPPRRPTGPPPAPVIERGKLEKGAPEWKVPLRKSTTVIRETEPGEEFPSISEKDQRRIKQWMERDAAYEDEVIAANYDLRVSMQTLFHQAAREQDWLGYPTDPQHRGPPRIQFPADRRAEQARGTRGPYRKPVPLYGQLLCGI